MKVKEYFIKDFKRDHKLGNGWSLYLTVKSFQLDQIRKRYLASKKNKSGKVGSVERREPALGGIIQVKIANSEVESCDILHKIPEPRGIARNEVYFAYSSENKVIVEGKEGKFELENEWFSYIHALDFSPFDPNKLLISSSGLDCIFEYDLIKKKKTWEWFAWEHYSNVANDPLDNGSVLLTRLGDEYHSLKSQGKKVKLIKPNEYLPTAMRAAFINSVSYSRQNKKELIATLFHEGKSILINQDNKQAEDHLTGFSNPHGGWKLENISLITSTSSGQVIIQSELEKSIFNFSELPNKHSEMGEKEWLQNSIKIGEYIITIDSNRTSFLIFNPNKKTYNQIAYPNHWAVQDLVRE